MTEVSEWIKRSNTICHYTRFGDFQVPNSTSCHIGYLKMVDLLRLFAEYRLMLRIARLLPSRRPSNDIMFRQLDYSSGIMTGRRTAASV